MWILGAALLAMQFTADGTAIGVGARSGDGEICVAMPDGALAPGTSITLIQPHPRQSLARAAIDRPVSSCQPLERAMIAGPYYLVRPAPAVPDSEGLWVVFPGRLRTRALASGDIAVEISPVHRNARVHACTSQEGVHLTVWAGTPLRSGRLWRQYFYLGYDVEPTCTGR